MAEPAETIGAESATSLAELAEAIAAGEAKEAAAASEGLLDDIEAITRAALDA